MGAFNSHLKAPKQAPVVEEATHIPKLLVNILETILTMNQNEGASFPEILSRVLFYFLKSPDVRSNNLVQHVKRAISHGMKCGFISLSNGKYKLTKPEGTKTALADAPAWVSVTGQVGCKRCGTEHFGKRHCSKTKLTKESNTSLRRRIRSSTIRSRQKRLPSHRHVSILTRTSTSPMKVTATVSAGTQTNRRPTNIRTLKLMSNRSENDLPRRRTNTGCRRKRGRPVKCSRSSRESSKNSTPDRRSYSTDRTKNCKHVRFNEIVETFTDEPCMSKPLYEKIPRSILKRSTKSVTSKRSPPATRKTMKTLTKSSITIFKPKYQTRRQISKSLEPLRK